MLSAVEAASPQHAHDMRKVAAYIYAFVSSMAFVLVSTAYNILFSFYQFFFANCCVVYVRSFLCYNYSVLVVLYTHLTDLYHLNDGRCFWWRTSARPGHTSSVKWTRIQQRYSRLNAKRGICFMYTYIFANRIHNHTCSQLLPWFKERARGEKFLSLYTNLTPCKSIFHERVHNAIHPVFAVRGGV